MTTSSRQNTTQLTAMQSAVLSLPCWLSDAGCSYIQVKSHVKGADGLPSSKEEAQAVLASLADEYIVEQPSVVEGLTLEHYELTNEGMKWRAQNVIAPPTIQHKGIDIPVIEGDNPRVSVRFKAEDMYRRQLVGPVTVTDLEAYENDPVLADMDFGRPYGYQPSYEHDLGYLTEKQAHIVADYFGVELSY